VLNETRPSEAVHDPETDRVGHEDEDHRRRDAGLLQRQDGRGREGDHEAGRLCGEAPDERA
jgi:hypothetical protein